MPIPAMRRYVCKKCGWKSRAELMSDCLVSISCPKCHEKTGISPAVPSPLDIFRLRIFGNPYGRDQNPYPSLPDWFCKKKKDV